MHLSRTMSLVSILAGTLLVVSAGGVSAKNNNGNGNKAQRMDSQRMDSQRIDAPSRASDRGMDARSSRASTRGANKRGFCPPGQAKKAGRGSAFNC